MIDLSQLTYADKGRAVIFTPPSISFPNPAYKERGTLLYWDQSWAFVEFKTRQAGGCITAVSPGDLEFETGGQQ